MKIELAVEVDDDQRELIADLTGNHGGIASESDCESYFLTLIQRTLYALAAARSL